MSYLLDTNVVSEVRKRAPAPRVLTWFDAVPGEELFVSVLTVGEIRQGIERLRGRDPAQSGVLEDWLAALKHDYSERVLAVTSAVAEAWGRLNAADPLPPVDGLLAATALVHGLTLVTRDRAFASAGVPLLDPWQ